LFRQLIADNRCRRLAEAQAPYPEPSVSAATRTPFGGRQPSTIWWIVHRSETATDVGQLGEST
jgi:hypothetical protein